MTTARDDSGHRLRRNRPRRALHGPLWLPLFVFAAVACTAAVYIGHVLWPRWPGPPVGPDAPPLPITVAGVTFNIPPAAIRQGVQRRPGTHERVDLVFAWPSLEPPDPHARPPPASAATPAPARTLDRVFVTIAGAGDTVALTERVLTIYPRYAAEEAVAGPAGLAVLPFREGTPYQGEDLVYDAEAPGFLVRCTRNGTDTTPGSCLYERRIDTADLVLRFPRDWLADWRTVAANFERLIARLRPPR